MHRHARVLLLLVPLCGGIVASTSGCAAVPAIVAALPTVLEGISDATLIIQQIETWVGSFFAAHPNAAQQAEITSGITAVRDALIVAERVAAGATDITAQNVTDAFANFTAAYNALMKLVADIGVKVAPPGITAPKAVRGTFYVPEPQLCHQHPVAARSAP